MDKYSSIYNNLQEDVSNHFIDGHVHQFSKADFDYLYFPRSNSFYRMDKSAYDIMSAVRNDRPVAENDLISFAANWQALTRLKSGKRNILRSYFYQNMAAKDIELFELELEVSLNLCQNWQIIINLENVKWVDAREYLTIMLNKLHTIMDVHQIRTTILVRIPYEMINQDSLSFFKTERIGFVPQLKSENYNDDEIKQLLQLNIHNLDVIDAKVDWADINHSIENSFRFTGKGNEVNGLIKQIIGSFEQNGISKSISNVYRMFDALSSEKFLQTRILQADNVNSVPLKCQRCWSQSVCWASKSYEAFGDHPIHTIEHELGCETTYQMIEKMIHFIYSQQIQQFEENNSRRNFKINNHETLELINP